jgi:hypothetical protein
MNVRLFRVSRDTFLAVVSAMAFVCPALPASATTLDEVIRPVHDLGEKCQPIDGEHAWSLQARTMYSRNMAGTMDGTSTQPVEKRYESFQCEKQKLTVYMYRYANDTQSASALEGAKILVWGGKSPNWHHPERMFTIGNILVVVSGSKPKFLANVIMTGSTVPTEKAR